MVSLNASGAGYPLCLIFSSDYCGELFLSKAQEGRYGNRTAHLAPSWSLRLQGYIKADTCQTPWQEYLLHN